MEMVGLIGADVENRRGGAGRKNGVISHNKPWMEKPKDNLFGQNTQHSFSSSQQWHHCFRTNVQPEDCGTGEQWQHSEKECVHCQYLLDECLDRSAAGTQHYNQRTGKKNPKNPEPGLLMHFHLIITDNKKTTTAQFKPSFSVQTIFLSSLPSGFAVMPTTKRHKGCVE